MSKESNDGDFTLHVMEPRAPRVMIIRCEPSHSPVEFEKMFADDLLEMRDGDKIVNRITAEVVGHFSV